MCSRSLVSTYINYIDAATFLPTYIDPRVRLPWKRWLDVAAKEELCINGWIEEVLPPGPDFDIKKLGAGALRDISGSYVDHLLNGTMDYEAFTVTRWSAGV
jgi:hypothetical protein